MTERQELKKRNKELRDKIKALSTKAQLSEEEAASLGEMMAALDIVKQQLAALIAVEDEESAEQAAAAQEAAEGAIQAALEEVQSEIAEVKAAQAELLKAAAKANRLPFDADDAPTIARYGDLRKYGHLDAGDTALMIEVLRGAKEPVSPNAYKALAIKLDEDKGEVGEYGRAAMKAANMPFAGGRVKADEINYSTLPSYGDEWVVTANSTQLWESIRRGSDIAAQLPSVEVPQGSESLLIPLEGTDPVFYKVAQATSDAATGGLSTPNPTVPSSRLGTAQNTLTVAKMGARVRWTGELDEDSIVPFAPEIRRTLEVVGQEYFDHVILDGDTRTGATTNINDIGGTPAGTEAFLLVNGMRYVALTTSGRNRSGGAVDEDDFVETMKLLGTAGEGADPDKCAFIVNTPTYFKLLMAITALKTADVYPGAPAIESGKITRIWGYPVIVSNGMGYVHKYSPHTMTGYEKKFNSAGKIDQNTAANNTTGAILLARWDRWRLGWKRRMTIETMRYPGSDTTEITALMRFGLLYRDTTAAAAISYNITL